MMSSWSTINLLEVPLHNSFNETLGSLEPPIDQFSQLDRIKPGSAKHELDKRVLYEIFSRTLLPIG